MDFSFLYPKEEGKPLMDEKTFAEFCKNRKERLHLK
jgi:hypothetical protein